MVGAYRVLERVGGGGMGVVHRAHDERIGRTVAIKFLQPHLGADSLAAERFRLEARAAGTLEHPNICTVHEIGETVDGTLFIVMPLYDGETLQQRMSRRLLPIGEAVGITVQVLRGLAKAHARGVVHRDIKPSNVLVTADGVVKLLDFGIAKLVDVTLTAAAAPLGTMAYMSPEQALGGRVDHRTDLWSLGVVLYEMLAGQRPYVSGLAAALPADLGQSVSASITGRRPNMPPALARVVLKAIARSENDRFQSAEEFDRALIDLGIEMDVSGGYTPGGTGRRRGAGYQSLRRVVLGAAALLALGATAAALWLRTAPPSGADTAAVTPATIAVLPFVDRSPERDQEYFGDGITEELIGTLSRIEGLRVASSTSVFSYRNSNEDVRVIGSRLGVATVLEGNVRSAANRLRITSTLVNVADGYQLWSETYDRAAGDAFAIQEEIARAIAQTLRVRLVGESNGSSRARPDAEAYDLYLRGTSERMRSRFDRTSSTPESYLVAIRFFEQAVARDSTFAPAYAAMATQLVILGFFDYLRPADAFPRAEAAARKALALDPTLGEPHTVIAYVELYHRWDLARAEEQFRRAIDLAPNHAVSHQWYGNMLTAAGRFPEAVQAMHRAQEADPLSLVATAAEGWTQYYAREYGDALALLDRALARNPDYAMANLWRAWALAEMDSLTAALDAHRRAVAASDSGAVFMAALARTLALAGDRATAETLLRRLETSSATGGYVPSYEIAKIHEALGRRDEAFAWLERARVQGSHSLALIRVDPQLDPLRSDTRFARLLEQVFADEPNR